ncbi:DUF2971 domain-containing protein [Pseudomonas oryzihabitans]|uniref:DUF2971 domain-containing protein n=1 Tax=Pseudomonas oryzihabitans TaxID=47885 RepID=UPI003D068538
MKNSSEDTNELLTLYHYTDQAGFLGIMQSRQLWATKIQYLNDSNEYKLALGIASDILEKKISKTKNSTNTHNLLELFLERIDTIKNQNVCVCSLSEKGDLLSQWRGYSNSLGGYSIGFDFTKLKRRLSAQGYLLKKCIYKTEEQHSIICKLIDQLLKKHDKKTGMGFQAYDDACEDFLNCLGNLAPLIKDPSFEEESEWRIVDIRPFDELDFRPGRSSIIPYHKIKLGRTHIDFRRLVNEIIVGHTPIPDLAVSATQAFVVKIFPPEDDDYNCPIPVEQSSIPYRNW